MTEDQLKITFKVFRFILAKYEVLYNNTNKDIKKLRIVAHKKNLNVTVTLTVLRIPLEKSLVSLHLLEMALGMRLKCWHCLESTPTQRYANTFQHFHTHVYEFLATPTFNTILFLYLQTMPCVLWFSKIQIYKRLNQAKFYLYYTEYVLRSKNYLYHYSPI